jgi:hypothetical protein
MSRVKDGRQQRPFFISSLMPRIPVDMGPGFLHRLWTCGWALEHPMLVEDAGQHLINITHTGPEEKWALVASPHDCRLGDPPFDSLPATVPRTLPCGVKLVFDPSMPISIPW